MTTEFRATTESRDEQWMKVALQEARRAAAEREVPVGAAAVYKNALLTSDHNRSIQLHDPTAHAELLVLRRCGQLLKNYRLLGVELYVTLEPCAMCAGGLIWARISRLVYGATDEKAGGVESKAGLLEPGLFNHALEMRGGVLADASRNLLRSFFEERRSRPDDLGR